MADYVLKTSGIWGAFKNGVKTVSGANVSELKKQRKLWRDNLTNAVAKTKDPSQVEKLLQHGFEQDAKLEAQLNDEKALKFVSQLGFTGALGYGGYKGLKYRRAKSQLDQAGVDINSPEGQDYMSKNSSAPPVDYFANYPGDKKGDVDKAVKAPNATDPTFDANTDTTDYYDYQNLQAEETENTPDRTSTPVFDAVKKAAATPVFDAVKKAASILDFDNVAINATLEAACADSGYYKFASKAINPSEIKLNPGSKLLGAAAFSALSGYGLYHLLKSPNNFSSLRADYTY